MWSIIANFNNVNNKESSAKLSQSLSPSHNWALDSLIFDGIYYYIE